MDIAITSYVGTPSLALDDLVPSPGAVDSSSAARFSELIDAPDHDASTESVGAAEAPSSESTRSLGDKILGGLQHISTDLQQTVQSVGKVLNGPASTLSARDMMTMQMGLSTMSIHYDLLSKAVSRSTQNLDQLMKLQ